MLLRILKNWTLPLAMVSGILVYLIFAKISLLTPLKPVAWEISRILTPFLIFFQLLLTFCKVPFSDLKPVLYHIWLLLIQLLFCMVVAAMLIFLPMSVTYREVFEGTMVCFIAPTATAAAVITSKLGGNAGSLTTYTLLSNILTAIIVPLLFPIVETHPDLNFITAFLLILIKVFPLLLCPFLLACFFKWAFPWLYTLLARFSGAAFYLWALALAIVSGQTVRSLCISQTSAMVKWLIALGGLLACCIQFYLGKRVGSRYGQRISGGQALGQKNTVLAIWMSYTYLNPLSAVGPGSYVLWQNIINSWQLWKKRKTDQRYEVCNK